MSASWRILIVRPDRIGDVVLATPLIRAIRNTYPDCYLGAMVRPYAQDVLLENPHLNVILPDDPPGTHSGAGGFQRQISAVRSVDASSEIKTSRFG